tara:strand:- start:579 stop:1688 length:1110 start_codon:yes stop_codon:yes gene_type:complete
MKLATGMKAVNFKRTHTLPFRFEVPNSTEVFLKTKTLSSSRIKFIKRYLYLQLKRQILLEINNITINHQKILWINISAPSLGDSLMDLSSRVMLKDREIDLFTDKKNAPIYKNDSYFSSVFSEYHMINKKKYDLVILDSYSSRSVYIKVQMANSTPFVSMFGYYNGPEVNRVLFSFHQMNNLLDYKKKENEINKLARPSIFISNDDKKFIKSFKLPRNFIAIVIGGEWEFRTFNNWGLVIEKLIMLDKNITIILIGSHNGLEAANLIINKFPADRILNFVAKFTFNQTAEVINQAKYTVCCDGGLLHASNAVGKTTVSLLAKLDSNMQLTPANKSFSLFDDSNVNNISVKDVLKKCREATNFIDKDLKD